MTTLLHEVVHSSVFDNRRAGWNRALGLLYAPTSGISASQFTRWHLDHHDNLGSSEDDPKRHWLSPKRNARWFKLLYCTPALIPIYFRAAASEARSYPAALRRTIVLERLATVSLQLGLAAALVNLGGWGPGPRVGGSLLPRLPRGVHAQPPRPALRHRPLAPAEVVHGHGAEPAVGLPVRLLELPRRAPLLPQRAFLQPPEAAPAARPLYAELGIKPHTYREIVWEWFVRNRAPHTDWDKAGETGPVAAHHPA